MGKFYRRRALRRWALILGLIGACTAAFVIWFIFAFAKGRITDPIGWLFVLFPLCSIAITLKWSVVGGVLHILESLVLTGLFSMAGIQVIGLLGSAGTQPGSTSWWILLVPLIAGLFLLASGILFLISQKHGEV